MPPSGRRRRGRSAAVALAGAGGLVALAIVGGNLRDAGTSEAAPPVPIPAPATTDLTTAVRRAGCVLRRLPTEGDDHATDPVAYRSNPPASGAHDPVEAEDGAYPPEDAPRTEAAVHALEHGRIVIQWRPGASLRDVGRLQTLYAENRGRHTLLLQNPTRMPDAVAATSWRHLLGCPAIGPAAFDAIRAFRRERIDRGPEVVP